MWGRRRSRRGGIEREAEAISHVSRRERERERERESEREIEREKAQYSLKLQGRVFYPILVPGMQK